MEADGAPFTPSLCQCSVLRVFKAIATRIRGKSKQTLKSPRIEPSHEVTWQGFVYHCEYSLFS